MKTPLPPLEKYTNIYDLIIPADVERKIRYLCDKVPQVEWSGTLFYTYGGSFEDNTLEIECVDIFPMDIGSQTYTEFDMSPDVVAYMTAHPELLDCQVGLIHSHNNMATFFSGTDLNTLQEEGNDRNHFVSLIVNNAGTYTAAVTRKLSINKTINYNYTYKSFDDVEKVNTGSENIVTEVIAYHSLNIIKEGIVINYFPEIEQRLEEIKEAKEKKRPKVAIQTVTFKEPYFKHLDQPGLFDEEFIDNKPIETTPYFKDEDSNTSISASLVKSICAQLITGSIVITDVDKIDLKEMSQQMVSLFDKRFENTMNLFDLWAETMVEFVVTNFVPQEYSDVNGVYISELCRNVYMTLDKLPENKYIKSIKEALLLWIE